MNITFLVGNGFDIRMGIRSSYKDIETYYKDLVKPYECIKQFQDELKEKGEFWSDFEKALGEYTKQFQDDRQDDFQQCIDDFTEELIKYLQNEEIKINYELCAEKIKAEFFHSISKYDSDIPTKYRNVLNEIINKEGTVVFRFVSFNYTHILDECLRLTFKDNNVVGKHALNGSYRDHTVNTSVLHIHGEVPGPIIMGVDNQNQILNSTWASQRRFLQKYSKPEVNARAGVLADEAAINLINNSQIICIYGMSLGETDLTWWKHIGNWLRQSRRRLIIFSYYSDYSKDELTYPHRFALEENVMDRFFDLAGIQDAEKGSFEDKIIVIINTNLFNINLVQLSEKTIKI